MKYKVKNLNNLSGLNLQIEIEEWIESRKHVVIQSINIWSNESRSFCTIVYYEKSYEL